MKTAIHWFRRDLRITDNTALQQACGGAAEVIPVFVVSDWKEMHAWTGPNRQAFLCGSLESLAANIESIGGRLIIRSGDAVEQLLRIARETDAAAIFFNRDPDPYGRAAEVRLAAAAEGLHVIGCKDVCIHERDEVLSGTGDPYRVFTPYSKAWFKLQKPQPRGRLKSLRTPPGVASEPLPSLAHWALPKEGNILAAGEKAARKRLDAFLSDGLSSYGERRDLLAEDGTSRLSQDLRFGLLSIREIFSRARDIGDSLPGSGRKSAQKYLAELVWREFYMQILWHFPDVLESEFNPKYRGMTWPGNMENLERWKHGETGFPIVDAAMRQLTATGFMHNRARMITAMFLTKDLHLDWRHGERWFMQQLTDGEIASNNGGWQWSAGTGADAAPYFRIQNPWSQTKRYDPEGAYIKRWVPELRDVPAAQLMAPPQAPLARGYPLPMLDHQEAREKTLELYAEAKPD